MRFEKRTAVFASTLLIGLICRPGWGQLTVYNWIATDSVANWNEAANWNSSFGNQVPDADSFDGEAALINNGRTALVSETVPKVSNLEVRNGTVDIANGGVLQTVVDDSGSGALTIGGAGNVALSGNGSLTVAGNASNSGSIRLGGAGASVSVAGDFITTGSLIAVLDGGSLGSLSIDGAATLGGSLGIDVGDSTPTFGQTWDLLTAGSVAGQFSSVHTTGSAAAPRGLQYQVVTSDTAATVKVGNSLIATIDRQTGAAKLENVFGGPVELTSYALRSGNGLLVSTWEGALGEGWTSSNANGTHVAELNLDGSRMVNVGDSLDLGSPYAAALIAQSDEDVVLQYTTADGQLVNGIVEFTGALNDIVLYVDPSDGSASMANLSRFLEAPDVTSYAILSDAGSLLDTWGGLAGSGQAGDGWTKANPSANHIAELNLDASTMVGNGTVLSLGKVLADGAEQDLQFLYTTTGGVQLSGTVQYSAVPTTSNLLGDCNQDGQLTAADLDCIGNIEQRDAVLGALNTLPGDLDGNGDVSFADFLKLSGNFGDAAKTRYSDGNIDLQEGVAFADFLVLSGNFGQVPAGAAAVPEPSTWGSWLVASIMLTLVRRRKRT